MGTWILIVVITWSSYGITSVVTEFANESLCKRALIDIRQAWENTPARSIHGNCYLTGKMQ